MENEGVIRYRMNHQMTPPLPGEELQDLMEVRRECRSLGLIGVGPDGIGFGNLSRRIGVSDRFIVSGSGTGGVDEETPAIFTEVTTFDIEANSLECRGPCPASSESLTHGACYRLSPEIGAVIHVHHDCLWHNLRDVLPTSGTDVPYGTPAMAREIARLWEEGSFREEKIMVMGGHPGGIIAVGGDLWEGLDRYRELLKEGI